ncbi:hypothetical protein RD792_013063 [Penstemon davidsonii]|uniref:Uncharacterized protein n=1 Tax=Penstemon davidsonii TaxID=160366 RepID=A0ABR0CU29_9LAMI|nr:hypothetical protein RD792_013063 [Penstemon davidsonii]
MRFQIGSWDKNTVISELTQGRELANELKKQLHPINNPKGSSNFLLEKFFSSYDNALSLLNCMVLLQGNEDQIRSDVKDQVHKGVSKKSLFEVCYIERNYNNGEGFSATSSSVGLSQFSASLSEDTCSTGEILSTPNLKIYSFLDSKNATKNFKSDMLLGIGDFGAVYEGWVDPKTLVPSSKFGTGMMVAIKI